MERSNLIVPSGRDSSECDSAPSNDKGLSKGTSIRLAMNADGNGIIELAMKCGFPFSDVDWSWVHPNWIIAEHGARLVGALQVLVGKPVGALDLLFLDPDMDDDHQAEAMKRLVYVGMEVLRQSGCQLVRTVFSPSKRDLMERAQITGFVEMCTGSLMVNHLLGGE